MTDESRPGTVDNIPEEIWDKVAKDVCRGFNKYGLAQIITWQDQPVEARRKFIAYVKDLTNRLYRSDVGADAPRIVHDASRTMMVDEGWTAGIWDERVKTHPDLTEWSQIDDPIRIKYALMVLILAAALKYHGHPVLIHLLP